MLLIIYQINSILFQKARFKQILWNLFFLLQVKIWFQNRRMKWRNSKERELLSSGGSRDNTLPNKNNPNPDLSDLNKNSNSDLEENSDHEFNSSAHAPNTTETPETSPYSQVTMNSQEIFRQIGDVGDEVESMSDSGEEEIDVS